MILLSLAGEPPHCIGSSGHKSRSRELLPAEDAFLTRDFQAVVYIRYGVSELCSKEDEARFRCR